MNLIYFNCGIKKIINVEKIISVENITNKRKPEKISAKKDHSSSPDLRSICRCRSLTNLASKQTGNWLLHELVRDKQGKKNHYNA